MASLGKRAAKLALRSRQGRPPELTDQQWEIAKLRKEGRTPKEIADKFGISTNSVWNASSLARRVDKDVPKAPGGKPKSTRLAVEKLIDQGLSNETIAKRLGLTKNNVTVQRHKINAAREPSKRRAAKMALYGTGAVAAGLGARDDD